MRAERERKEEFRIINNSVYIIEGAKAHIVGRVHMRNKYKKIRRNEKISDLPSCSLCRSIVRRCPGKALLYGLRAQLWEF